MRTWTPDEESHKTIMSNADHVIDVVVMAEAMAHPGRVYAYPAWDFRAYVWYGDGAWFCQVWVHHKCKEEFYRGTLLEVMDYACLTYGDE